MTGEELKKKIKEILRKRMTELLGSCHTDEIPLTEEGAEAILFYADEFADALIAAGIGDIREAEHRAEVAKRMLKLCENAYVLTINGMNPYAFSLKAVTSDLVVHEFLRQQIEKELAEEGKND